MDADEEAGLRAFVVDVGCRSEASYPGRPLWVQRNRTRVDVSELVAEWVEEERRGYRVKLADGTQMLLYYVPELDLWSGLAQTEGSSG